MSDTVRWIYFVKTQTNHKKVCKSLERVDNVYKFQDTFKYILPSFQTKFIRHKYLPLPWLKVCSNFTIREQLFQHSIIHDKLQKRFSCFSTLLFYFLYLSMKISNTKIFFLFDKVLTKKGFEEEKVYLRFCWIQTIR